MKDKLDVLLNELSPDEQSALLEELHRIARRYMTKESNAHTLQATALVNQAYLNLSGKTLSLHNHQHLIAIAARQMRRILVDHARQKLSQKRQKDVSNYTLADVAVEEVSPIELIHLDRLLEELRTFDERAATVFELRLFSGLHNQEIADVMDISLATVERDAKAARAWLQTEIQQQ